MSPEARYSLGIALLLLVQVLLGTTVVHLIRRKKRVEPGKSWGGVLVAYVLLVLGVTALSLLPFAGLPLGLVVSLVALKRLTGLDVVPTFILAFSLGVLVFLCSAAITALLQVDVLSIGGH